MSKLNYFFKPLIATGFLSALFILSAMTTSFANTVDSSENSQSQILQASENNPGMDVIDAEGEDFLDEYC